MRLIRFIYHIYTDINYHNHNIKSRTTIHL